MSEVIKTGMDGKHIRVYRGDGESLPVVYSNDFAESGEAVLTQCAGLSCPPFHLVTVSGGDWNQDLSPWPTGPVLSKKDHFTGKAPDYLKWYLEKVIPFAEECLEMEHPVSYISGYSMAGLFALWSLYQTDRFSGAVCASGSLWYPGFDDFARSHPLQARPSGVYLSLGDRESAVKNPTFRKTETIYKCLNQYYTGCGLRSCFELNPGNHFKDPDLRVARGIKWILSKGAM